MKKHIIFLFCILLSVLLFSCKREEIVVYDISPERFISDYNKAKADVEAVLILDTRSAIMYSTGHLKEAINIPKAELEERIEEIADLKDLKTYVYDRNIELSYEAIKVLIEHGFRNLYNCAGTDEYDYEYVSYRSIRLSKLAEMAKSGDYVIIDYRMRTAYDVAKIPNAVFVEQENFDDYLSKIPFSENGYLIYSIGEASAVGCAQKMQKFGFSKIYVCRENVMQHLEYLTEKVIGD